MEKTHEIAGRTGNPGQCIGAERDRVLPPAMVAGEFVSLDISCASDRLPSWAAQSLRAHLCFIAQARSTVYWTPALRRRVAYPCRPGLDVLEVHWGTSEAETRLLLQREFGMTLWEDSDV